jgi:hypothetical protein
MNYRSIGVCLVGGDPWVGFDDVKYPLPKEQYEVLVKQCINDCLDYNIPVINIGLHRDYVPKPCPGYAVDRDKLQHDVSVGLGKIEGDTATDNLDYTE